MLNESSQLLIQKFDILPVIDVCVSEQPVVASPPIQKSVTSTIMTWPNGAKISQPHVIPAAYLFGQFIDLK